MSSSTNRGKEKKSGKESHSPTLMQRIILQLDGINRDRDPEKFKREQFPKLQGLVEELRKSREGPKKTNGGD